MCFKSIFWHTLAKAAAIDIIAVDIIISDVTPICLIIPIFLFFLGIVPNEKPDVIEFSSNGDQILGGGLCFGTPLFFSKTHGVMSITPNDSPLNDT